MKARMCPPPKHVVAAAHVFLRGRCRIGSTSATFVLWSLWPCRLALGLRLCCSGFLCSLPCLCFLCCNFLCLLSQFRFLGLFLFDVFQRHANNCLLKLCNLSGALLGR